MGCRRRSDRGTCLKEWVKGRKELTNKIVYEVDKLLKGMQCLCSSRTIPNKHSGRLDEICDKPRRSGEVCGLIGC